MGLGNVGLESYGNTVLADRFIDPPLVCQSATEIGVGRGEFGRELNGRAILDNGRIELPLEIKSIADIKVGIGGVRHRLDRFSRGRSGLVEDRGRLWAAPV